MSNPWVKAINELAEWMKIRKGAVVPFIGAGISRAANLPTWGGLANAILETVYGFKIASDNELNNVRSKSPMEILTYCRKNLGDEMFRKQVTAVLSVPGDFISPEVARLCWKINNDLLVTTNLDDVLERASSELDGEHGQALTPHDSISSALQSPGRCVLHLHGIISRFDTWVMTEDDYASAISPTSPVGATLQSLLLDRILLFLGFSCNDPGLNFFLERFKSYFPKGSAHHFALIPNLAEPDRRRLFDYGIFPIEYTPSTSAHPEVHQFLEEVFSAFDPKDAETWADAKERKHSAVLASVSDLRNMALGARRDCLDQEFKYLYEQASTYALTGASELPPAIKQRRAETLEFLAGVWQVDSAPPLNALDGRMIIREIGRGGFGIVWLVEDVATGEQQALKVAHFQETTNFKFVERFKQGIRAMRRLTLHGVKNTTQYLEHREVPLCVFMEYVDGGDLSQLIRDVPLPVNTRARLCRDIANIVARAHSIPVYHRDLKPSNVLIRWNENSEPQVVLSDFDLAWFEGAISRTTTRIGDQAFASPEQLKEGRGNTSARAESDVYSLGMLCYFVVGASMPSTGQWYNRNLEREVLSAAEQEFTWLVAAQRFASLVVQCAAEVPSDRPSAQTVADKLHELFCLEDTNVAQGTMFIEEIRLLIAKGHGGFLSDPDQSFHVEQRRNSGRTVVQVSYMRQLAGSDDRGRFRNQAQKDVDELRKFLEGRSWSIQSQVATSHEAKLVGYRELVDFSLATAKQIATQLTQGLDQWLKRA